MMGCIFEYGWDVIYNNFFNVEDFYYEVKVLLIYIKGKKVFLIGIYKNMLEEFFNIFIVEYLFEKMMIQVLIWYKECKFVDFRVEFILRRLIIWMISWNIYDGLFVSSIIFVFDKQIENWL